MADNDRESMHEDRHQRWMRLSQQSSLVQISGNLAERNRISRDAATRSRQELEKDNAEFATVSMKRRIGYYMTPVAIGSVYGIDVSLFGPSADYFATQAFPDVQLLSIAARAALPAIIVGVDLWVGTGYWRAYHTVKRQPETASSYRRWRAAAATFVGVMPLFASSATIGQAMAVGHLPGLRELIATQGLGTLILALVTHAGILLGAEWIKEALGYFRFQRARRTAVAQEGAYAHAEKVNAEECVRLFQNYWHELRSFNRDFDESERPGPFDRFTMTLINERMGRDMVPEAVAEPATTG
jgi:hypothetical protein